MSYGSFTYGSVTYGGGIALVLVVAPTAITQPATNITTSAAKIKGKISDDGGAVCEARFRHRKNGVGDWVTSDWQGGTYETDTVYEKDISSLDSGTEYEFQTQAKNSEGEGAWSASDTFTTTATGNFFLFF